METTHKPAHAFRQAGIALHVCRWLTLVVSLTGCEGSGSPEAMYRNYLGRLANVTGVDAARSSAPRAIPPYPATRELHIPEVDIRIGIATYWSLGRCGLLGEVSQRNTSLARFAGASGRLLNDMEMLQGLATCERRQSLSPTEDHEFIEQIATLRRQKAEALPRTLWNASFAAPEFRIVLATAVPPLKRAEELSFSDVDLALGTLTRLGRMLIEARPDIEREDLERHYFHLQVEKRLGKLLQGMELSRSQLEAASQTLERTDGSKDLCPAGRPTERAGYLQNVFRKYYAGEIQPYLSSVHRQADPWLRDLQGLRQTQRIEPPQAFTGFYESWIDPDAPAGLWQLFNQALRRHTEAWRKVLSQCGMLPTGPQDLR